jgi:2,4-dienoyl-CoA reductase (NADPH2)
MKTQQKITRHFRFHYRSLEELKKEISELGLDIPLLNETDILGTSVQFGRRKSANRLMIHPMEGCDGETDGRPGALTLRRYDRFAAGGAGVIWVEACAVVPEGRANPRQLWINRGNIGDYSELVKRIRQTAKTTNNDPVVVLQLTHAGRYSKPYGILSPVIAHHSPIDTFSAVTADTPVVTDAYLDSLQGEFAAAARLAYEAGFDAVDIKACHRYLISELLASFTRGNSRYGGDFTNRIRFLCEVISKIRAAVPELDVVTRLNLYDGLAYPYGWGVDQENSEEPDLSEPLRLIGELRALGVRVINATVGNPYYLPHLNRPYDKPIKGGYPPPEHPLTSINRFLCITGEVQQAYPDTTVIGSGYSWLRQFIPQISAGVITQGWASMVGLGRMAFAYPDFARDILTSGQLDKARCCLTCSVCTQLMRDGKFTGCTVRDQQVYGSILQEKSI